jgi:hypothetical protein
MLAHLVACYPFEQSKQNPHCVVGQAENMHTLQDEKLHNFNMSVMLTTLIARPFLKSSKTIFSTFFRRPMHFTHHCSQMINMPATIFTLTCWCDNIYNFLLASSGLDASFKDFFFLLLTRPRKGNSWGTPHNSSLCSLDVKIKTSQPYPVKVNTVLNCICNMQPEWF